MDSKNKKNQKKRNSMAKTHLSGYKSPKHFSEIAIPSESTRLDSENVQIRENNQPELDFKETSPNANRSILGDIKKESQNAVAKSDDESNIPIEENSEMKTVSLSKTKTIAKSDSNTKVNFRASQQFLHKKIWKRQFKVRHQKCNQKQTQINKADMENIQNIKNQIKHHNNKQQHTQKNSKPIFNKKSLHCSAPFAIRSKFFLPDKRPRKEVIIPPTKFLLGGNISDPLNLNSLQDEALNATPTPTPKQSPITTPPKVEVIIPPNIHDPLHLLDPVDSVEYEKLLVSPMKRKSKSKHRNRKKKPKKRKRGSELPVSSANGSPVFPGIGTATASLPASKLNCLDGVTSAKENLTNVSDEGTESKASRDCQLKNEQKSNFDSSSKYNIIHTSTDNSACNLGDAHQKDSDGGGSAQKGGQDSAQKSISNALVGRRNVDREKAARDLRLDLASAVELQQQTQQHVATSSGAGRKRKISEGLNSAKNKFRRMDSMDKIVSPVIPQPGAWKRPPRTVPSGARKMSRVRSTSVSEIDLISPTEETRTESESIHGDTPDVEALVKLDENNTKESNIDSKPKPKFRPEGKKYQYGNYDRYPGYRNLNDFMDVRLQVFLRNAILFKGKDVLDVGCNIGHITIVVAKDLAPKSILGIDIDQKLIYKARKNLSMYVRIPDGGAPNQKDNSTGVDSSHNKESIKKRNNLDTKANKIQNNRKNVNKLKDTYDKPKFFPISFPMCLGPMPRSPCPDGGKDDMSNSNTSPVSAGSPLKYEFPKNINFRTQNYVLLDEALLNNDTQQYDLILCLSVTKWIHLNFGDNGLKLAFKRMFNQLRPGGKLILEAQNWASYKKKKNLTETIYNNYKNIEFFPNKFHEYLLSNEVGFSHSYTLGVPRHLSKGFCRPIQLYAKGDFTPSHIRWSDAYYPQTPYEAYRGIYASMPHPPNHVWNETPRGNSGSYSCRQTPMHQPTSQYYNPLETDSYLPSYDTEVLNRHYVFASPLYQTVWSPPASMRNSSSHTPVFGSVRECDLEDGVCTSRHVYPPTEEYYSPQVSSGAFNSIREVDSEECTQYEQSQHVYASCESSSSPNEKNYENSVDLGRSQDTSEGNYLETNPVEDSGGGNQVEGES